MELNETDRTILRMLQADARTKLETLAAETGASVATVQRRIKALKVKIEKYEQEERAETVLVVHSGDVGKSVLKKAGIKVNAGRKLKRLAEFDGRAFQQGEADAQEIDLERRAIEAKSG